MIRAFLVLITIAFALSAFATDEPARPTPMVKELTPSPAKCGGELVALGQYLGKEHVGSVYLTRGDDTYPMAITSQTAESIKATIPSDLRPGRYGFMVLMRGEVPRYIDEPVYVNIE